MKSTRATLLHLAALALFSGSVAATPVTYQLNDWGHHLPEIGLGGSIVVDDADGDRLIVASEILDWSFSGTVITFGAPVVGPFVPMPFAMAMGAGSQVGREIAGCFKLDGQDLVLDILTQGPTRFVDASGTRFDVSGDRGLYGDAVPGDRIAAMRWFNTSGVGFAHMSVVRAPNHMRIASTGAVPEPSSAALMALALTAAVGATGARGGKGPGRAADRFGVLSDSGSLPAVAAQGPAQQHHRDQTHRDDGQRRQCGFGQAFVAR